MNLEVLQFIQYDCIQSINTFLTVHFIITITYALLRHFYSLFQSEFPTERDLVFPLPSTISSSTCLRLSPFHPVVSICPYGFFLNSVFQVTLSKQYVTNSFNFSTFYCMEAFFSSLTPCKTFSFFTQSFQMNFILLHHYMSKPLMYS